MLFTIVTRKSCNKTFCTEIVKEVQLFTSKVQT